MDFKKIFLKDVSPTKIGGQAVLEGIMMKGEDRTAVALRVGKEGRLYIKTEKLPPRRRIAEIPIVRGVYIFVTTLLSGMQTLLYSAEVLERFYEEDTPAEGDVHPEQPEHGQENAPERMPEQAPEQEQKQGGIPFGVMIALSVAASLAFVVGVFIIVPTIVVNFIGTLTDNAILLNLFEGALRIVLFIIYIVAISRMKDIRTTFEYHGAEHKTIHCFESGLPLTPDNASQFESLHPRCGTSFLMFVMIIALLIFSLLGWPNLAVRIASRIVFIPVIAGLSFELLRFAGRSDSWLVKLLSVPGLLLQQLTTKTPDKAQLEVAIAALSAVLVPADTPELEGFCDQEGRLLPEEADPAASAGEDASAAEGMAAEELADAPLNRSI